MKKKGHGRRNSNFNPKKNTHPTKRYYLTDDKKRASTTNVWGKGSLTQPSRSSLDTLPIPDSNDLYRSTSLGPMSSPLSMINEREDESYNFERLVTKILPTELEKYKEKYCTPKSIYERLLPECNCDLCEKKKKHVLYEQPPLQPAASYDSSTRKRDSISKGYIFRTKSLQIHCSTNNINELDTINDLHYDYSLACACNKDQDLSLIEMMSIGDKNSIHNFMHILNDINSKMIFNKQFFVIWTDLEIKMAKSMPTPNGQKHYNKSNNQKLNLNPITDNESIETPQDQIKKIKKFSTYMNKGHNKSFSSSISSQMSFNSHTLNNEVPLLMLKRFRNINSLHQAIKTYHKRLAKPLDFNPKYIIYDDVDDIIDIIKVMSHIVKCLVNGNGMPIQFDLLIIPERTEINKDRNDINNNDKITINVDQDDDDDDDDDGDDGDISTDDEEKDEDYSEKHFGNINDIFELFKYGLHNEHHDHFYDKCIVLDRSDTGIRSFKTYLTQRKISIFKKPTQNGRYVTIIDRGGKHTNKSNEFTLPNPKPNVDDEKKIDNDKNNKNNKKKDYMYFFQPPKPFGDTSGHNTLIEILHLNTLECLLPKIIDKKSKNKKKKNQQEKYSGAKDLCNGQMICISFHVLSEDEIRCYLYIDQKYIRIDLDDYLEDVLSEYIRRDNNISNKSKKIHRTKYNEWAFPTKDTKFEDYFNWVQEELVQETN